MPITKATATRPYIVTDKATGKQRIVQAGTSAQALRHVAADTYTVAIAKANDVIALMASGVKAEVAGAEPEAEPQGQA